MYGIFKKDYHRSTISSKSTLNCYTETLHNSIVFSDLAWLFVFRIHKWDKKTFCSKTGLHESYYDNIRNNQNRAFNPKKSKVLSFCFALNLEEALIYLFLDAAGHSLNPVRKIDYIYLQMIKMDKDPNWTMEDYNDLLDQFSAGLDYTPIRDDYFGSMSNDECLKRRKKRTK